MDDLTNALIIVLSINVMLWFGQVAVMEINPSGYGNFSTCSGTLLAMYDQNNCTNGQANILKESDINNDLPKQQASTGIIAGVTSFFVDTWTTITTWINDTLGFKYVWAILTAPSNFLKVIGVPSEIAFGIGALWYGVTFFMLIAWLRGI